MSVSLITGDVNFDHLVKVLPARFLYCRATLFFFSLCNKKKKNLVRKYIETMQIFCFSSYFGSLMLASLDDSCPAMIPVVFGKWCFFYFYIYSLES